MSERQARLLPYVSLIALGLIWGGSFLFIKVAVHDMSPTLIVFGRSVSGALALALIMVATGRHLFTDLRARLGRFVLLAALNGLIPWALIAWGETHISSGLASILNSTTTLWTAIFIYWVIPAERPSVLNYAGVLVGIAGIVILVTPDLAQHGISGDAFGALAVIGASVSYAVAALFVRVRMRGMNVYEQSLGQLVATAALSIPFAVSAVPAAHLHLLSVAAVLALGVGGSGIGLLLYYYSMQKLGAVRAAGVTFLVPITAVFWGAVLLHESLTVVTVIGMVVTLAGILLTNRRQASPRRESAPEREAARA